MRFIHLILLFAVSSLIVSCSNSSSKLAKPGVSLDLANYRAGSISDVVYNLTIDVPEDYESPIQGSLGVNLELRDLSQPLILDFKVPENYLESVKVDNEKIEYTFEDEHIIIDKDYLKVGYNSLDFKFRVGETSLNRNLEYLYTLFVPDRARTAFPCFDQPNLKAKYNLTLTLPSEWQAIANGAVINEKIEGNQKTITYAETKPLSTYLFDFVVGDFKVVTWDVDGMMMTMLHRETDSLKVANNVEAIFNLHKTSVDWLEDYTGIEYPFQKFGFAIIPSFQYGGMEHPGAITYKAASLFLDESATQNQLLRRASLIAHETAHMWFGDLVTMEWFNDVWMKEVFANFMAAKIVHPSFPEINHDLRFLLAHYPSAYAIDRSKGSHPIQQPLDNLKDAGTLYGSIIYQKAPIAMRMLERKVGEKLFQDGMKKYLNDFTYDNANWDDLISILDSLSEDNIDIWSQEWIKNSGIPYVTPFIRTKDDGETIKEFSIFQRNLNGTDQLWIQDLAVTLDANDSTYHFDVTLDDYRVRIREADGLKNATFIMCNSDGYGYGYFALGPLTKKRWLEHIEDFEDPVHRGIGWISLYEATVRRAVSTEDYLKTLVRNLPLEKDPLIQQYMLNTLQTIYWKLITPEDRTNNASGLENLVWNQLQNMNDNKLKRSYFNAYKSIALSESGVKKLYDIWNKDMEIDGLTISENDYTQLACELALRDWPEAEKVLEDQIERIENKDRKERLEFIRPSLSANKETRDEFFESLKVLDNRHHESWVQTAIGYLHHPLRAEESIEYIRPTLEMLEEIQQTGDIFFPKRVLDNTFSGHTSMEALDIVRQFLYRNNHYPQNLKNKILQASDLTFRAAERLEDRADSVKVVVF